MVEAFYIDKIFNFQNMFLFSNAAAAAGANHTSPDLSGIPTSGQFVNNRSHSPLLSTTTTTSTTSITPDFQSFMKQNLMQNFFSYYSNGSFSHSINSNGPTVNDSKNVSKSTNFSIDNILSSSNGNNSNNRKNNDQNPMGMNTTGFNLPPPAPMPFSSSSSSSLAQYASKQNYDQSIKHLAKHTSNNSKHFINHYSKIKQTNPPMALTALIPPSLASMISSASSSSSSSNNSISRLNSIKQFGPHKAAMMTNSFKHSNQESQNNSNSNGQVKSKNAKKYKCDLCGRGFSRSNTLITHRVSFYLLLLLLI